MPTPSPYVTPAVLAGRVLRVLAVVSDGQEPTADDSMVVLDEYDALHAEMTQKGEIEWPIQACPQSAVSGIRDILAARCMPMFGVGSVMDSRLAEQQARVAFFRVNARPASAGPTPGQYF